MRLDSATKPTGSSLLRLTLTLVSSLYVSSATLSFMTNDLKLASWSAVSYAA